MLRSPLLRLALVAAGIAGLLATSLKNGRDEDRFLQLRDLLPTPNAYRTASGAPGPAYWQQRADYEIDVTLDEDARRILGSEQITYANHSPDTLRYLWVQLDPNLFAPDSHAATTSSASDFESVSFRSLQGMLARAGFDGRCHVTKVVDRDGRDLEHTIVGTMMRIDLRQPLGTGDQVTFGIDWNYRINDARKVRGRTGFEYFEEDGNCIFEMAQWFPRMAAYTDYAGWQHKQYLGRGEFTLEFGDYRVRITVPDDHLVAATGVLQNPDEVLTREQRQRLEMARTSPRPLFVVTPEEARENQSTPAAGTKTWEFLARDVRDFAFASSRKFIWDAAGYQPTGPGARAEPVLAMSFYPNEGEPLWSRYSTHAVLHTLEVYGKFTFPYPYPVAISVNGPVGGMEYPMICFNGPRPEEDGTYSERTKYGLIGVVIHEVGHNWFPMIVNSDERQWTWMDEGLNTFVQFLTEQEWEDGYPSRRGDPQNIVGYMTDPRQVPIMTQSDSVLQLGSNAYAKPATALNILRETVLGRELFDFAFQEYANRWAFKRPEPADFFRTMEDASAVDLDWFWRGWFFTTDHVDLAIEGVRHFRLDSRDPDVEKPLARAKRDQAPETMTARRNRPMPKRTHTFPELLDFYNEYDELDVTEEDRETFRKYREGLDEDQRALLDQDMNYYVVTVRNEGGLPMPVILLAEFADGSTEEHRVAAEIWRQNDDAVRKLIQSPKALVRVTLDPHRETADADLSDNVYPPAIEEERVEVQAGSSRWGGRGGKNPMQKAREAQEKAKQDAGGGTGKADAGGGDGG